MSTQRNSWFRSAFVKHLLLALGITIILIFIIGRLLRWYTHHGDVVVVPQLSGFTLDEVTQTSGIENFNIVVIDSVYDIEKKKGSIAFQDPPPASLVKRNRTIYLTLVAMLPEQVRMPALTDMTLRQATAVLETYGLKPGRLDYVPDIARNAVLKQRYKGRDIETSTWIEKGSYIDLVLGKGAGTSTTHIPFLLGMKRNQAIETLQHAFFVLGKEVFEDGKDTINARVYRQIPAYSSRESQQPGESIDLIYRSDKKFDFDTYLKQYALDSIRESLDDERDH